MSASTHRLWSLRGRLVVLPSAILLAGLAATIAFYFYRAQIRVAVETDSGLRLARVLVGGALARARSDSDPIVALERLERALPSIRHVDFIVLAPPSLERFAAVPVVKEARRTAPFWFARLFRVTPRAEAFPIKLNGRNGGEVIVVPNPLNEIAEIWDELTFLAALLVVLAGVIVTLLVWSVGRGLRPIRELSEAFDGLEHGRFETLPKPIRVAELHRIGERFDSLVRSLARATADNHRLIDRLISVQEAERKELARELHDEFGPSLFGIRAEVSCIRRWARGREPRFAEIEERARAIGELADGIQRLNARMLARLRPLVLDRLGLAEALNRLVADWRERCPAIAWSLDLPQALALADEEASLTLFRVVQESLTNAARHAAADAVSVSVAAAGADDIIAVRVRDNGRGFPPDLRFGFGLLGIAERIRARNGRLTVGNGPLGGALVEVVLPLQAAAA